MAFDTSAVSELIGSQEIAGTTVNPRGYGKKVALQREAGLLGEAAAAAVAKRASAVSSETPAFARIAYLAVTEDQVALIDVEPRGVNGRLGDVIASVPRNQVVAAKVSSGVLNTPVSIAFSDGGSWEFEVSRLLKKRAQRVIDVLAR